jgi:hypothetical protein
VCSLPSVTLSRINKIQPSLETLRALGRSKDSETAPVDYSKLAQERQTLYKDGILRMAEEQRREQIQDAYLDVLVGYDEDEWPKRTIPRPGSSRPNKNGQSLAQSLPTANPVVRFSKSSVCETNFAKQAVLASDLRILKARHDDIRERIDYAHTKTMLSLRSAGNNKRKLDEREARYKAEMLDQVPASYQAWKVLDEGRRTRIARFLQLADGDKNDEVKKRKWSRDDAMTLNQAYRNEVCEWAIKSWDCLSDIFCSQPDFQTDVNALLAKRVTTDPRRRPTASNPPSAVPQ